MAKIDLKQHLKEKKQRWFIEGLENRKEAIEKNQQLNELRKQKAAEQQKRLEDDLMRRKPQPKIQDTDPLYRSSDYTSINQHTGKYKGGKALIILGGESGKDWEDLCYEIDPDVLIGVNGVNEKVDLDYWIIIEGSTCDVLPSFQNTSPTYRLVHSFSFNKLEDKTNAIRILRQSEKNNKTIELEEHLLQNIEQFNIRQYGQGLLSGDLMKHVEVLKCSHRCGTVAVQAIHWAAILGCDEIHTIGLDLMFGQGFEGSHHWYEGHQYIESNPFWKDGMFTNAMGVPSSWFWIESAEYILKLDKLVLQPAGIKFVDHSKGMLDILKERQNAESSSI